MGNLPTTAALLGAAAQPTDAAKPAGHSPLVRFSGQEATPSVAAYLGQDDSLQVLIFPSIGPTSVLLEIRFMRPDGTISPMEETIAVPTAFAAVTFNRRLGEGYILTASLSVPGGASRGAMWAQLNVLRGFPPAGTFAYTLVQGYIGQRAAVFWPYGPTYSPTDGQGFFPQFSVATPGAGADWQYLQASNTRARVVAVRGILTTNATVANRQVKIVGDNNVANTVWMSLAAPSVIPASSQFGFTAGQGLPLQVQTGAEVQMALPVNLVLGPGQRLSSATQNIQAGDQWSQIWIQLEEWVDN